MNLDSSDIALILEALNRFIETANLEFSSTAIQRKRNEDVAHSCKKKITEKANNMSRDECRIIWSSLSFLHLETEEYLSNDPVRERILSRLENLMDFFDPE